MRMENATAQLEKHIAVEHALIPQPMLITADHAEDLAGQTRTLMKHIVTLEPARLDAR